jgi:hypothetical protein
MRALRADAGCHDGCRLDIAYDVVRRVWVVEHASNGDVRRVDIPDIGLFVRRHRTRARILRRVAAQHRRGG